MHVSVHTFSASLASVTITASVLSVGWLEELNVLSKLLLILWAPYVAPAQQGSRRHMP